jgi:hypothetical protein
MLYQPANQNIIKAASTHPPMAAALSALFFTSTGTFASVRSLAVQYLNH